MEFVDCAGRLELVNKGMTKIKLNNFLEEGDLIPDIMTITSYLVL